MRLSEINAIEQPISSKGMRLSEAMETPKLQKKSVGEFVTQKLPQSAGQVVGSFFNAIIHPIKTAEALVDIPVGITANIMGLKDEQSAQMVNQLANLYKQRYGSVDKATETAYNDPIGFLQDISMVVGGGANIASKVPALAKGASVAGKVARAIDITTTPIPKIGSISELPLKAVGGAVKTIAQPFAKSVQPQVIKASKELGIATEKIPASVVSKSPAVRSLEALSSRGLFGQRALERIEDFGEELTSKADDLVNKSARTLDKSVIGQDVINAFDDAEKTWYQTKNALYEQVVKDMKKQGQNIPVDTSDAITFLDNVIEDKTRAKNVLGKSTGLKELTTIRNNLMKPQTADKIYSTIKELNEQLSNWNDPITTGNSSKLKYIRQSLSNSLDDTLKATNPDMYDNIKRANDYYSTNIQKLNSTFGKTIERLKTQPTVIVDKIINPKTSVEHIQNIKDILQPEVYRDVQGFMLDKLLKHSKNTDGQFVSNKLSKILHNTYGDDKLSVIFTPEQLKSVYNIETLAKAYQGGQRIASGSQTAFLTRLMAEIVSVATNPIGALKAIMGDATASSFINSPSGQRLLTTGSKRLTRVAETIPKVQRFIPSGRTLRPVTIQDNN